MLFSKAAIFTAAAALASLVQAQGEQTPEGQVKVHVVQVGDREGNLKFYPEELEAEVGDMVQFHFYPRNHSVARSTFAEACNPVEPSANTTGFFSGFMPVQETDTFMPTFTILVNETTPIWYYCATGRHCQNGMAGVINPPKGNAERTLEKYKEAAATSNTVVPGPPSGGETDPDGPEGPEGPETPVNPDNTTTPNPTNTNTPPSESDSAASSFVASAATVLLGAVAVAFFLV